MATQTGDFANALSAMSNQWYAAYDAYQFAPASTTTTNSGLATAGAALYPWTQYASSIGLSLNSNPDKTLEVIKDAIHVIKAEVVDEEVKNALTTKSGKYRKAGLKRQADLLDAEITARVRLARIKEWDYKVLPYKAVQAYDKRVVGGWTMMVHIDPIDKYMGINEGGLVEEALEKIVPEDVVDKLIEATDRQVFDEFYVLWVEKVKDPLLLGKIKELNDYFLVAAWGDDVKFDDIIKASKKKK
jgi:hypothetical protein